MTDDPGELEVPDVRFECGAHRPQPGVIGARQHTHVCGRFPEHEPPHVCHSCGATWSRTVAVA